MLLFLLIFFIFGFYFFSQYFSLPKEKSQLSSKSHLKRELDIMQLQAVTSNAQNILVIARRTVVGKTFTIVEKVKYLVENEHISPNKILLIAFTNKAANEMTARNQYVKAMTFHKLGLSIILKVKKQQAIHTITFQDMITKSIQYIKENKVKLNYEYIIVDEFQDISEDRYELINAIKVQANARLFCVGDDWQSIYGFSGSNIDLFYRFEKYFGETQIIKLEKTYRNSQELIQKAALFIQQNPNQIQKKLYSNKHIKNPIVIIKYSFEPKIALEEVLKIIYQKFGEEAKVLLLGRTKYDFNEYISSSFFYFPYSKKVKYLKYPNMNLTFMTVHEAKGLESENVVILNMKDTLLGFPNQMEDSTSQLVETYPYAEERRLFYVALTRTQNRVYLITPQNKESCFLKELKKITSIKEILAFEEQKLDEIPICPHCKNIHLKIKEIDGIKYWECPNCMFGLKNF